MCGRTGGADFVHGNAMPVPLLTIAATAAPPLPALTGFVCVMMVVFGGVSMKECGTVKSKPGFCNAVNPRRQPADGTHVPLRGCVTCARAKGWCRPDSLACGVRPRG